MAESVGIIISSARTVYNKFCQVKVNREGVDALALRVDILIGFLSHSQQARGFERRILSQLQDLLANADKLADEFASASQAIALCGWSDSWTTQCKNINRELTRWVQLLGMASDGKQLQYLEDIQAKLSNRRLHDQDVSDHLRLPRQAVLQMQQMNHNKSQTTVTLKNLHQTILSDPKRGLLNPPTAPGIDELPPKLH